LSTAETVMLGSAATASWARCLSRVGLRRWGCVLACSASSSVCATRSTHAAPSSWQISTRAR